MLTLTTLSSGSAGNCYLLQSETETLILDCGIPIKEIKKGLNFDLRRVSGVLVTHSHL
jgi:phosphoribosyl 1,2-cyclic phosphodiesterase